MPHLLVQVHEGRGGNLDRAPGRTVQVAGHEEDQSDERRRKQHSRQAAADQRQVAAQGKRRKPGIRRLTHRVTAGVNKLKLKLTPSARKSLRQRRKP